MNTNSPSERVARRIVAGCALVAVVAALAGILIRVFSQSVPWVAHLRGHLGMALHTSWPLLFLSLALFAHNRWPQQLASRVYVALVVGLAGVLALVVLARLKFQIPIEFEVWLAKAITPHATEGIRRMSPHTALSFLCVAGALGCLLSAGQTGGAGRRRMALALAAVGFVSGVIATLGLGLGTPLLFGHQFTTMKWSTASIFVALTTGLMFAAFPRNWLLQGLLGETSETTQAEHIRYRRVLAVFLLCFAGGLIVVGFLFLRREQANLRAQVEKELETLADLTVARITEWRRMRLQHANLILYTPFIARRATAFIQNPKLAMNRQMLVSWLESSLPTGPYTDALILDERLNVALSYPDDPTAPLTEAERRTAELAHRNRAVMATDLHRTAKGSNAIRLSIIVPLVSQWGGAAEAIPGPQTESAPDRRSQGVLILRMDARETLFPILHRRPFSSRTIETYLVGREGEELVFLSDLRHATNAALRLRESLTWTENPAVRAALHQELVFQGKDYRGIPVLAATRVISGSPWSLVVQVEEQEVYAPVRARGRDLGLLLGVLTLAAAAGLNLLWRQRDNQFLRRQVAAEHEQFVLAQRVAHLMDHANDIIVVSDDQWRILEVNVRGLKQYGYTVSELQAMRTSDLRTPAARADFTALDEELRTRGQVVAETVHQRKDGSTFPVEISAQTVALDGYKHTLAIIRDITERKKRAEAALRASESRYRSLVDTAQDTVFTLALDGTLTSLNPAFEIATGWSRDEWMGRSFTELVQPGDLPVALEMATGVGLGKRSPIFEVRVRKKTGDFLVAQILAAPLMRDGKVDALLGISRDVTAAKRLEESLRESENKLKLALKASLMGVWDWNVRNNTIVWSPECFTIFGVEYFAGTIEGFTELVHPEDRSRVMTSVNDALTGNTQHAAEFRILRPDGKPGWVSGFGEASYDANGQPLRMVGTALDITERKQAEEALRKNEERYRAVVEDQTEVICRFRENGTIVFVNDVYCRFFGKTPQEVLETKWHPAAFAEDIPEIEAKLSTLATDKPVVVIENRVYDGNGSQHWMQFVNRGFFDSQGRLLEVQSVGRDVTERKQAEDEIHKLNESLEQRVRERTAELEEANRALRESEAQLRLALTASEAATWSWDVERNVSKWDAQYQAQYGFSPQETISQEAWLERIHPDDRERLANRIRTLIEPGASDLWNEDFRVLHPVRGLRWMTGLGRVERNPDGRAVRFAGINLDITQRKQAEEALKLSEARNRLLSERTFEGIVIHEQGRIIDCNLSFANLFGYELAELIGSDGIQLLAPAARESVHNQIEAETTGPYETTGLRKNGSTFAMEVHARMITMGERRLRFGSCRDVTERKAAEEEIRRLNASLEQRVRERTAQLEAANEQLRASETQLKQTTEAGRVGLWDWDLTTNRVFFSPEWKRQIGYEDHEISDDFIEWQSRVHPEDIESTLQKVRAAVDQLDSKYKVEFRFRHKNGTYRWILAQASLLPGPDGKPRRMLGSHLDITEHKQAEQEIQSLARFPAENPNVVVRISRDAELLYANPAAKPILRGFTDGRGRVTAEWRQILSTALTKKEKFEFEREINRRIFSFIVTPFLEQGYANIYGVDITELKRLQQQLLEVSDREQARIGQDLHDGLGQVLVTAAFDLNRLQERLDSRKASEAVLVRQTTMLIDLAITQARGVARGLLAVQLGGDGLSYALQSLAANVTARYEIACDVLCPKFVPVENDAAATHLFRIAQEAVTNAAKHAKPSHIAIRLTVKPWQIELTVTDDGKGMPPAPSPHAGMGLHIMDYRARAINGWLKIESTPTKGTRVFCSVPRQQPPNSKPS